MKRSNLVFIIIGATIIFFSCAKDDFLTPESVHSDQETVSLKKASKPASKLTGTTHTDFTFTPPTFWNGTIDFCAEGKYGLTFISMDAPRDFSQASPFEEDFIIYELGSDWTQPENVYLRGSNSGVVSYANKAPDPVKFRANGQITEASGPLELWLGRKMHISGVVTFPTEYVGLPEAAIGTLRIN